MEPGDAFECACGREQHYAPKGEPGGITEKEAKMIGWVETEHGWKCPFCSGNVEKLRRVMRSRRSA